jgi:hypothetical protein
MLEQRIVKGTHPTIKDSNKNEPATGRAGR